jgi:hypothetical protein
MSKVSRENIEAGAADATIVDLADDYDWEGEHDFADGTVLVAAPTVSASPVRLQDLWDRKYKQPVRVRAQTNVNLSAPGATIDGVTMSMDNRFWTDVQTVTSQDGLYLWKGASTPAVRSDDAAAGAGLSGAIFPVMEGIDATKVFECTNLAGVDVAGTDDLTVRVTSGEPERITNLSSTCLLTGGKVTVNGGDSSKVDISAGTGVIVNNYTDPVHPTRTYFSWPTKTAVTLTYLASANISYLSLVPNGVSDATVVQQLSRPSEAEFRDQVTLAGVGHTNRTSVSYVSPVVVLGYDTKLSLHDFLDAFGSFVKDGNVISNHGTDLRIKRSAGSCFISDANYYTSAKTANGFPNAAADPQYYQNAYRNSSSAWISDGIVYNIDPNYYDPGGGAGKTAVTAGKWTIQYGFMFAALSLPIFQLGQVMYDDKATAVAHVQDSFTFDPDLATCVFRCYLVVQQGTTDLSDGAKCVFIPAGKFGLATMIAGTGSGEVNTASNIGTSGVGVWAQKSGVDLQFKNVKAASTKVTVVDEPTGHTVNVDVTPGNIAHQDLGGAGTNTHGAVDLFIASKAAASGLASLNASSLVVQEPASKAQASGLASLNASSLVVQNPASASATPGASVIPIAGGAGTIGAGFIPALSYEPPITAGTTAQYWRGDKTWQTLPTSSAWPKNHRDGFGVSRNGTNPNYQIDIAIGVARSDDDTTNLQSTATITIGLNASGVNGLDTGSEANSTWYYIWIIYNPTTLTYAGLFSTNSTSPTMPSGYTKKRRVGVWYNNSSGNLRAMTQVVQAGRYCEYLYDGETAATTQVLNAGSATSFTDVPCAALIPPTSTLGIFLMIFNSGTANAYLMVRTNGTSITPSITRQYSGITSALYVPSTSSITKVRTDGSQIIEYANSVSGESSSIYVNGFIDIA